jgi:hypothetical protein
MYRRACWVALVLCCALTVLYGAGPAARLAVHELVGIVCHGTSAGKILFALAEIAVCFMCALAVNKPANRRLIVYMLCFAATGYAACMASYLTYVRSTGVDTQFPHFQWRDGINSVNAATHIHTSKTAIARALLLVGRDDLFQRFDTGAAFLAFVPAWLSWIIGAAFTGCAVLAPRIAAGAAAKYPEHERFCVLAVLACAAACGVKCILDGGPLAYDAVSAAIAWWLLIGPSNMVECAAKVVRLRLWLVIAIGLWVAAMLSLVQAPAAEVQLWRASQRLGVYLMMLSPIWFKYLKGRRLSWVLVPVSVGLTLTVVHDSWESVRPLLSPAPAIAMKYDTGSTTPEPRTVASGTTAFGAYVGLHEVPTRARNVSLAPRDEHARASGLYAELVVLKTTRPFSFTDDPVVHVLRSDAAFDEAPSSSRMVKFRVQVEFDASTGPNLALPSHELGQIAENERFVAYFLLDNYLRRIGVSSYVLVPYATYAGASATAAHQAAAGPD